MEHVKIGRETLGAGPSLEQQHVALAELGRRAVSTPDFDDFVPETLRVIRDLFGADLAAVVEVLEGGRSVAVRYVEGPSAWRLAGAEITAEAGSLVGDALRSTRPILVSDAGEYAHSGVDVFAALGIRSGAGVIVDGPTHPFGVLGVGFEDPHRFTVAEGIFLQGIANLVGLVAVQHQSATDLRELEARLTESQKMEAIGRLAGGVAHDFNNLLTALLGSAELAMAAEGTPAEVRADLEEIQRSGRRAEALVDQLLAFSRRKVLRPEVLDPREVIASMFGMLSRIIRPDLHLRIHAEGSGLVSVDRGQLEQVVTNFVVNARDAIVGEGAITIETRDEDLDLATAELMEGIFPGPHTIVSVSDTGTGMDAGTASSCFEPFFTTKPQGVGTGLGLSTVFGIVKQSGGHVTVSSELGSGSTFRVFLPRAAQKQLPQTEAPPKVQMPGGTETVLVVEDEPAVRSLVRRVLERLGYQVVEARGAAEALAFLGDYEDRVHLLLTDLSMPGMSGLELATRVRAAMPSIRVLLTSGYSREGSELWEGAGAELDFLEKPFGPAELAGAVRRAIDGGTGARTVT